MYLVLAGYVLNTSTVNALMNQRITGGLSLGIEDVFTTAKLSQDNDLIRDGEV